MIKELKIGDYVRNTTSGKFGYVADISPDNKKLTILTIHRTYARWAVKNVEPIKDAMK